MSLVLTKGLGFCYSHIATLIDDAELAERKIQVQSDLTPSGKQLDTFAAEFPTNTNYLFATYAWFVVRYFKDI
jgi:carbamoyl-phosphate synthase / aspartate carbamoyltransferase